MSDAASTSPERRGSSIFDQDPESLRQWAAEHDLPRYLGDQVLRWVHERGVIDPKLMSDVSRRGRELLLESFRFGEAVELAAPVASDSAAQPDARTSESPETLSGASPPPLDAASATDEFVSPFDEDGEYEIPAFLRRRSSPEKDKDPKEPTFLRRARD